MSRSWIVVAALVGAAAVTWAQDAAPSVADAVAALSSPDAKLRDAAVERLAALRSESVPEIVTAASAHPDDDAVWMGLSFALARWQGVAGVDALSRSRESWPPAVRSRFDVLVHDLRVANPFEPIGETGVSPPEIAAKVREILAKSDDARGYRTPNPDAEDIAKLGREAIATLVESLRARRDDGDSRFASWTAADALGLLAEDADVPLIRRLMDEGCESAARSLDRLRSAAALDALVRAVERDIWSYDLMTSLTAQGDSRRADLAVVGWLERHPAEWSAGTAAEFLSSRRCAESIPALAVALDVNREARTRASLGIALARLGDQRGIEALVGVVEARGDAWSRRTAGEALNDIVGRRVLIADDGGRNASPKGNFDAAAAEFRAWWKANADGLTFDGDSRRWRSPGAESMALPESPPDVAARVRKLLDSFDGVRHLSAFSPQVREIVGLGRPAVPELLRQIRDSATSHGWNSNWARASASVDALKELVTESDVPTLARLLVDGHADAARCFEKLHSDAVRDALLAAVKKGMGGYDLAEALRPYESDAATQAAVLVWLEQFGAGESSVGKFAELVVADADGACLATLRRVRKAGVPDHALAAVLSAIARLGGKEGIEALVALAESADAGATTAAVALNSITGRHAFETNTLGPVGRTGNIDEACVWFRKWWEESKDQLVFDGARKRWTVGTAPPASDAGKSPPEVAAKVAAILARTEGSRFHIRGPVGDELAALGRDAIPALVERIRDGQAWDSSPGFAVTESAEALGRLRTDADVPLFTSLLRDGYLAVARSLSGCRDPRAREALLAVVAHGSDSSDVMDALATMPTDASTWEAVRSWLGQTPTRSGHRLGDFIEEQATRDDVPVLREFLAMKQISDVVRFHCASALVRLGEADAIPLLIAAVERAPARAGTESWQGAAFTMFMSNDTRIAAAHRLNAIAGERLFIEKDDSSYADVAQRFRDWWIKNGAALKFDARRRVWTTGTPAPGASAAVDPALSAKVRAIVEAARRTRFFSYGESIDNIDPHAKELIALGRPVLPVLVETIRNDAAWTPVSFDFGLGVVAQAIVWLATEDDRTLMFGLLDEGRLSIVRWFVHHPTPAGRDAVLRVVGRGFLQGDMLQALEPFAMDPPVQEALVAWAVRYGKFEFPPADFDADEKLAAILGTPAPGTHAPVLADLLQRPIPARVRCRVAAELAKHGVRAGVEALVAQFAAFTDLDNDDEARVALALNDIAGTKLVEVEVNQSPRGMLFDQGPGVVKDDQAGADRVRKWWAENGERLRFDDASGKWTTSK